MTDRRTAQSCMGPLVSVVFLVATMLPGVGAASPASQPAYVALGDSIEVGAGDTDLGNGIGYVPGFRDFLAQSFFMTPTDLHNLGELGATTKDINLIQLAEALDEVLAHRAFGIVISLGGGGNNLRRFIQSPQAATCLRVASCLARLNALLNAAEQDVDLALSMLRAAAGPGAPILVRTQYNPLRRAGCDPGGQAALGDAALEGLPGSLLSEGLNDRLRALAAKHGAAVVELFLPFALDPDGLIAEDCIHPNDAGYAVILGAFTFAFANP